MRTSKKDQRTIKRFIRNYYEKLNEEGKWNLYLKPNLMSKLIKEKLNMTVDMRTVNKYCESMQIYEGKNRYNDYRQYVEQRYGPSPKKNHHNSYRNVFFNNYSDEYCGYSWYVHDVNLACRKTFSTVIFTNITTKYIVLKESWRIQYDEIMSRYSGNLTEFQIKSQKSEFRSLSRTYCQVINIIIAKINIEISRGKSKKQNYVHRKRLEKLINQLEFFKQELKYIKNWEFEKLLSKAILLFPI